MLSQGKKEPTVKVKEIIKPRPTRGVQVEEKRKSLRRASMSTRGNNLSADPAIIFERTSKGRHTPTADVYVVQKVQSIRRCS